METAQPPDTVVCAVDVVHEEYLGPRDAKHLAQLRVQLQVRFGAVKFSERRETRDRRCEAGPVYLWAAVHVEDAQARGCREGGQAGCRDPTELQSDDFQARQTGQGRDAGGGYAGVQKPQIFQLRASLSDTLQGTVVDFAPGQVDHLEARATEQEPPAVVAEVGVAQG